MAFALIAEVVSPHTKPPTALRRRTMEREALKLALEDLEDLPGFRADIDRAITAIKEALAQPEQMREAYASITIRVGNRYIQQFVTQEMFLSAKEPWWLLDQYAKQCVEKLKENT
jgi:hypothetical protein